MRLVFSHVQYHVELCLSKVCFTTCHRILGGRGGAGKKKLSFPCSLPSQSLQGGWLGVEFVAMSQGLGLPAA